MSGDFIYRHHEVHRSKLQRPKKKEPSHSFEIRPRDEADANKYRQRLRAHAERLLECTK